KQKPKEKWHCVDCNTTESVWACLSCSHVACGRYIEEHALKHFQENGHPVALEVNELYVFCYLCDDYVLNDNATGDLKLLRSTLSAIKSQNYECTTRKLKETYTSDEVRLKKISDSPIKRRPTVTPGVTGLRNLGNTCYMNSILQVLSHLLIFRECFLKLDLNQTQELLATAASGKTRSSSKHPSVTASTLQVSENQEKGKGSSSVRLIPAFRGYAQQDAQEFLCELLDKVQQELETTGTRYPALIPASQRKLIKQVLNVVNNIFHGQLLSQVTCLACDNKSNTIEPFWDLSLEFPERYHCNGKEMASQYPCLLTEMLAKFTETEALEGKIYACDQCNKAQKQLMVCRLPQVLRLHLKRFRWSGRNHREKIGVHVNFDQMLNMEPYCCRESLKTLLPDCFIYDLSAVVMHHGKGFGSGHYTAYCYNSEGGFWVHCNDSKLNMCTMEEVCKAQAYILFYSQRLTQANGHGKVCPSTAESQQHTELADCSVENSSS
uniref:Ubiquitin carboxyl-terminal hydrolase n=1 Tax=Anas platyrhynchos TaxID=8839 RepID=A0A8B9TJG2_ANAPL